MASALIPGSFDPITVGHLDIIRRTAARFDKVYVAIMINDMAKYAEGAQSKTYLFSMEERLKMAELACETYPRVEVISADGMLIDLVDRLRVDWIVKGVRSVADFAYEQKHALWNRAHNPRAETLYMPADPAYDGISSTLVRQMIRDGESLEGYLPDPLIAWLIAHPRR